MNQDEWEYEYEDGEEETFYITLDLSNHTPPVPVATTKSKPRASSVDEVATENGGNTASQTPSGLPETPASTYDTKDAPVASLRILDLHTENPIISFNSQFYTCYWATDIGTNLYFTPPQSENDSSYLDEPLRSFPSFNLLAKTRARLVAVPARLKPSSKPVTSSRTSTRLAAKAPETLADTGVDISIANPNSGQVPAEFLAPPTPSESLREPFRVETQEGDTLLYSPAGQLSIAVPSTSSEAKTSQARFLERWSELRSARGRKDYVPIKAVRNYRLPEGWEAERAEWLERDRLEREADAEAAFRSGDLNGNLKLRRRRRRTKLAEADEGEKPVKKRKIGRPPKIRIHADETDELQDGNNEQSEVTGGEDVVELSDGVPEQDEEEDEDEEDDEDEEWDGGTSEEGGEEEGLEEGETHVHREDGRVILEDKGEIGDEDYQDEE